MNFLSAHRSSSPIWSGMQSVCPGKSDAQMRTAMRSLTSSIERASPQSTLWLPRTHRSSCLKGDIAGAVSCFSAAASGRTVLGSVPLDDTPGAPRKIHAISDGVWASLSKARSPVGRPAQGFTCVRSPECTGRAARVQRPPFFWQACGQANVASNRERLRRHGLRTQPQ
jgi:hypothetical protein